jgi:glycosyltransferase involved in cell wall biosynthesis
MAGKNAVERRVGYFIEKRLMRNIDALIVVNQYVAQLFRERYGDHPVTIVQNTPLLPSEDELRDEETNYWRSTYHLADTDVLLLFQGGITPERGLEECIQALSDLPERYKLILLGGGRIKTRLRQLAEDWQVSERVFMHDQVPPEDILWYTKQADIGLVMYKNTCQNNYYSTPNKVFEYMLAGIPTIASNHPGKQYVVEAHETGVCVPETPRDIRDAVLHISEHADQYRRNAREKRSKLSWQEEKQSLVLLYQRLSHELAHVERGQVS